jgi:hypothetical protein
MNYQIKVLRGLDEGDYIIVVAHGSVDITGFEQILDELIPAAKPLLDCKILVDFQDSVFRLLHSDVIEFLARFEPKRWPHNNKIAFICSPEREQYMGLGMVGDGLLKMKLRSEYFTRCGRG